MLITLYNTRKQFNFILAAAALLLVNQASAEDMVNAYKNIAMDGFDVVAYFTQGKPVAGARLHKIEHKGEQWLFSSAQNAEAFSNNPEAYEPQFNGWCAYAISEGYGAEVDFINGWAVLDGKLYLNWDKKIRDLFIKQQEKRKPSATQNWPAVHRGLLDGSIELYTHEGEGADISHPQKQP